MRREFPAHRLVFYQDIQRGISDIEVLADKGNLLEGFLLGVVVIGAGSHLAAYFHVELDLRLGAGRTDRDLGAVGGEELEYVGGGGEVEFLDFVALPADGFEGQVVLDADYGRAGQLRGRILAEVLHHLLDFLGAGLAGTHYGDTHFVGVAVLDIDVLEHFHERQALFLSPGEALGHEGDSGNGVLVAAEGLHSRGSRKRST